MTLMAFLWLSLAGCSIRPRCDLSGILPTTARVVGNVFSRFGKKHRKIQKLTARDLPALWLSRVPAAGVSHSVKAGCTDFTARCQTRSAKKALAVTAAPALDAATHPDFSRVAQGLSRTSRHGGVRGMRRAAVLFLCSVFWRRRIGLSSRPILSCGKCTPHQREQCRGATAIP